MFFRRAALLSLLGTVVLLAGGDSELRPAVPAPYGPELAAGGEPGFEAVKPFEDTGTSRLLCVDFTPCGSCCASFGRVKKFLRCCDEGGGSDCHLRHCVSHPGPA